MSRTEFIENPGSFPTAARVGVAVGDLLLHTAYRTRCPRDFAWRVLAVGHGDTMRRHVARASGSHVLTGDILLFEYRVIERETTPGEDSAE